MASAKGRGRLILAAVAVVALAVVVATLWWWWQRRGGHGEPAGPAAGEVPTLEMAVELYFPTRSATLGVEPRQLAVPDDPEGQLLALARTLLAGPETPALLPPLPAGVEVRRVYLGPDGVAYVDLVTAEPGTEPPSGGSTEELLRVYSLVDTLALNVPQAERVALLWNGEQRESFSGHLDTSRPLAPDTTLVERRRP